MLLDSQILQLDIKVQDKYRKLLSKLGQDGVELKCVQLGDSDIDYELSPNIDNARILNAPYNVESIKYPLIYNGAGNVGSRLAVDNMQEFIENAIKNIEVENFEIVNRNFEFPDTLDNISTTQNVYRNFIRIILELK